MNVLIVDDDPTNMKLLRATLEHEGHTVAQARDGIVALETLERCGAEAIISDILMPRMDGYRLCYEVRKSARFKKIPFIVYTATYLSASDEKLSLGLGADVFLRKPATAGQIFDALQKAICERRDADAQPRITMPEVEVLKEYSQRLVVKLEEKNSELTRATKTKDESLAMLSHELRTPPFLQELKRRNVYKVAVAYIVASWALSQGIAQVFPVFDISNWIIRLIVLLIILGLPVALVLAWMFEITPEGIKRTATADAMPAAAKPKKYTWLYVVVIGVAVSVGLFLLGRYTAGTIATPRQSEAATGAIPVKSIAVLPFGNLSDDKQNAYFADGVQDEILTDLAKVADLKVISRTSVMQYKSGVTRNLREIARELGVAHVVEGIVQRSGNRVRVSAQLIDARTDMHLWAERYDRDLADVFAIQSEIAKTIADQLQAKISPSEKAAIEKPPTQDLAAFDLYEHAKAIWADVTDPLHAREKLPQAVLLLGEAVSRDPHFLQAWCLLSRVHGTFYWYGFDHTSARLDLANAAVQTALRLQPDSGEAHLALANYYYYGFRDYGRAGSELAIARRTLPNNAEVFEYTGFINRRQGHWADATRNLERALELDPRNLFTLQQLASYTYQPQRRYADAVRTYDRALTIVPGDPLTRINWAEVALDWRADIKPYQTTLATLIAEDSSVAPDVDHPDYALCERTAAAAARALANYPRDGLSTNYGVNCPHAYWEGVVAHWQGDSAKAHAAFTAARRDVEKTLEKQPDFAAALSLLGMIDAGLGRKEEALREGRRACELLPISKDAITGTAFAVHLAHIYAWTGEKDLAIEQIAAVERVPNVLSYGLLKLHPYWDSLRGDPRFEKIVASLAPQT
jgi:TolB-like protein/CheY-like chemotaxis protein/Flp pilus assembly protein TadD